MNYPLIQDPEFVDLQKTRVRFKLVKENGSIAIAELTVPPNREAGVNQYWDRIVSEFDVEEMRQQRNKIESARLQQEKFARKKREGAIEAEKLRALFNDKVKAFELPYVKDATDEDKAAIRRAPDKAFLDLVLTDLARKFMTEKNMTHLEFLDFIEDWEDAKNNTQESAEQTS